MSDAYNLRIYSSSTMGATPSLTPELDQVQYKIYSDLAEIRGLSQQWENLVATSPCNKAFASLEWYIATYYIDGSAEPYVIAAVRGSEMAGILPLVLDRETGEAMFPDYGSDYNDVLLRVENPALGADLLRYAISVETPCRHLQLSKLRPDSNCLAALHLLKDEPGIECRFSEMDACS
ncbi:MAG TPA: hypothetical protein VI685_23305, partial [Candidatus Angelobacter sp.]